VIPLYRSACVHNESVVILNLLDGLIWLGWLHGNSYLRVSLVGLLLWLIVDDNGLGNGKISCIACDVLLSGQKRSASVGGYSLYQACKRCAPRPDAPRFTYLSLLGWVLNSLGWVDGDCYCLVLDHGGLVRLAIVGDRLDDFVRLRVLKAKNRKVSDKVLHNRAWDAEL
jgi:hypothetical protein